MRRAWKSGSALYLRLVLFAAAFSLLPTAASANWTATGRFMYVDRDYDQTGFTGSQPNLPIRYADVQIVDANSKAQLAKGPTDANGNFSIAVVDSKKRNVYARVVAQSTATSDLFIAVQTTDTTKSPIYYAVVSSTVSNHSATANQDFGTNVAQIGSGGEAFDIFDQMVRGADYIKFLTGSRPGSSKNLKAAWSTTRGNTNSYYDNSIRTLELRDTAGYDDTPIIHEMGHYFVFQYSASDNPGGSHTFSDCVVDIRLAWEEGVASYWGNSALRYAALPHCNIYTRTDGGSGPGHLVRYADLETDTQYGCTGDASEVNVFTVLWDINDSASTTDTTPGVDDGQDLLALDDSQVWEVMRDYMPTASNKSAEDFWDGWFKAPISNGFKTEMLNIWRYVSIDFSEDGFEANTSAATAKTILVGAGPVSNTFFSG